MSAVVHCDRPNCRTWVASAAASDAGFLRVTWHGQGYDVCSVDHLLQFFAHVPPMEEIANA